MLPQKLVLVIGIVGIIEILLEASAKDLKQNDSCSKRLNNRQTSRNCKNFNGEPCLCELTGNCRYNEETKICMDKQDCEKFNDQPLLCRYNHCIFDCGDRRCVNDYDYNKHPKCEIAGSTCGEHCSDACFCKHHECTYRVDGTCKKPSPLGCSSMHLYDGKCLREGVYYLNKGEICKSDKSTGNCAVDKTIDAVNFGGQEFTDSRGVQYKSGNSAKLNDIHNIKAVREVEKNKCTSEDCKLLYKHIIYGEPTRREEGRCLSYNISICEDGFYEFIISTIEDLNVFPGEKTFNIKLGGKYVISEIDVISLSREKNVPIEIVVLFEIKDNILVIDGYKPMIIRNNTIPIDFCYGECIFMEGTFQIAAFAVTKLTVEKQTPREACKGFDGIHWDCINAGCNYDMVSKRCTNMLSKCPAPCGCKLKQRCRCYKQNVQILFLLDNNSKYSATNEFTQKVGQLIYDLKKLFPISQYALAYANHFKEHRPDFLYRDPCYERVESMTSDANHIHNIATGGHTMRNCDYEYFPALLSLVMAAQDLNLGWEPNDKKCVSRIIILMTRRGLNREEPNGEELAGDGYDTCQLGTDFPPSLAFFNYLLSKNKISLFYVLGNYAEIQPLYEETMNRAGVESDYAVLEDSSIHISKQIQNFVYNIYNRTNNCYWTCVPYVNPI